MKIEYLQFLQNFYFSQKIDVQYKRGSLVRHKNQLGVVRREINSFGRFTIQRSSLLWRFFRRR